MPISLGISTCPNDTFAFHGILTGAIDTRGLDFEIELLDVQQLNDRLLAGHFDAAKTSFHAALHMTDQIAVLSSGSALGFGVGPVLLSHHANQTPEDLPDARVLCPGQHTTAAMLYRMFHPEAGRIEHVVFSEIMPALQRRGADFGVCIHEGRFTYREQNLHLVEDLGDTWERATDAPLPLGGIVGRLSLGDHTLKTLSDVIRDSIDYAYDHRDEALQTMRRHAQEQSDDVIWSHVDLYVNDRTRSLGTTGRRALEALSSRARAVGIIAGDATPLRVVPD